MHPNPTKEGFPLIISIVEVNFNWNSKDGHEKKKKKGCEQMGLDRGIVPPKKRTPRTRGLFYST